MLHSIKSSNFKSIPRQALRLDERHKSGPIEVDCDGLKILVQRGVYSTAEDTQLMMETVKMLPIENFLEVGCGTGVISIFLAKQGNAGIGVDINDLAVENSRLNAQKYNVANVKFLKSNGFENVKGKFDIIICNPPYTKHDVLDDIDRMFWDPKDEMKTVFFSQVSNFLNKDGRVYFGWANFGDIDRDLPLKLAAKNSFELVSVAEKSHGGKFDFLVLEFKKKYT